MQLNETIVIGFLVVVILVLIFSKISVKFNGSNTDDTSNYNDKRTKRMNNNRNDNAMMNNNNTKSPDDLKTSGLLSNDFKKQLDEIENRFYTSSCPISK
jgi:hypothetical protein